MARPVTLFTGQWADLPFETICAKARSFGYDGVEIACWGDHIEVDKALSSDSYLKERKDILEKNSLKLYCISNHLVGQAVCDRIDERHKSVLPPRIWGDGKEDGVRARAAQEMIDTAKVAKKLGLNVVAGFTGSPIWAFLYSFPPNAPDLVEKGYQLFADMWNPILDEYEKLGVKFALEAHPTEIAFDIASAERAIKALNGRKSFGFNYDPSHFGYQGVDYVAFIRKFSDRIYHVHMKDVYWSNRPTEAGVFGGHLDFGDPRRFWDFRSLGRGCINFEEIIRALNDINYGGPLSVEWEDGKMDREQGATEACAFVKKVDFTPSKIAFDSAFEKK